MYYHGITLRLRKKISLKKLFEDQPPKVVVTLGRVATQAFERSGSEIPQIIGALDISSAPFPDPVAFGRRLGIMALQTVENPSQALRIEPLTDFKVAVNARIARHLGIFGGHEDLSRFDLVLDPTGGIE